jgi:hypothetical protein|tara:strand:- start:77 stop:685 length:609 start_codon:yes stop_codon:yes gene_type:complete
MGYVFIAITWIFIMSSTAVLAVGNQTNSSGSNTAIEGNYTGGATTYESGSTSTSTTNSTSTSNIKSAPFTSSAPSMNTSNNCALSLSAGVQNFSIGASLGRSYIDKTCELIALSTALRNVGMKVASIAILCQDERVFKAFMSAGTPCPTDGKIGAESMKLIVEKYNYEMPTYEKWVEYEKKKPKIIKIEKLEPIKVHNDKKD